MNPCDARSKFVASRAYTNGSGGATDPFLDTFHIAKCLANPQQSTFRTATSRSHYPSSLLPEASSYTLRGAPLSSTTRRHQRLGQQLSIENGDSSYEPETPTERLRRLRFETEELEAQLEQERVAKKAADGHESDGDEGEEAEYEENDIPIQDDADKTRPQRRRRKKARVNENGELTSAVLLAQLKRLRGDLGNMNVASEDIAGETEGAKSALTEAKTRDLLQKLGTIRKDGTSPEIPQSLPAPRADGIEESSSRVDERLQVLEKYVGANEAEVDEVRLLSHANFLLLANVHVPLKDASFANSPAQHSGQARTPAAPPYSASTPGHYLSAG